jgi:hypothetical protein
MEVKIEKQNEVVHETKTSTKVKLYNPAALNHHLEHRMKSIEITDEYTRIDFIFRSSKVYINGGWIQMERDTYISPTGSSMKYRLIRAIGIPIAPIKHYFKNQGEYHTYSLIFPALPTGTERINIIEKEAPGSYFNFYGIDYSKWMTVPHPMDVAKSKN